MAAIPAHIARGFVYIAAFGLFTDVSYEIKQEMKNVLGHLAYVLEGATRIFDIPSYKLKVTHDGETIEDEFIYEIGRAHV